jgi:group I intron endonuclease
MSDCGVYQIVNIANGKKYIGSSNQLSRRFYLHKWDLRRGKHHSITLQRAWDKYGEENFVFTVLFTCPPEERQKHEQAIMDHLQTSDPAKGYNICCDAAAAGKGRVWTEEQKKAKSIERKGKKVSPETYQALLRSRKRGEEHQFYGKRHTDESRRKMSASLKGREVWNKGKHTNNNQAKITPEQVIEMRELSRSGELTQKELAEKYCLKRDTIWKICTGRLWPNVGGLS